MMSLAVTPTFALVAAYVACANLQRGRNRLPPKGAYIGIGADAGGDGMTLSAATIWAHYRDWLLLEHDPPRAPRTVAAYRYIVWDFIGFLDPKPWHRATKGDLRRYVTTLDGSVMAAICRALAVASGCA